MDPGGMPEGEDGGHSRVKRRDSLFLFVKARKPGPGQIIGLWGLGREAQFTSKELSSSLNSSSIWEHKEGNSSPEMPRRSKELGSTSAMM